MDEYHLHYFKRHLENLLLDLYLQADETVSGLKEMQVYASDPLDRAVVDEAYNFKLRIRGRERILINKIRQSLEDIENNEYGICEDCGEDISIARLKARPVASRCIYCKTKQEDRERALSL